MERASIFRVRARGKRAWGRMVVAGSCLAMLVFGVPSAAVAKFDFKSGRYTGKTQQESVTAGFRKIEFKITKKGRVILMTEPVVRRNFCTSVPVFTLEGATPRKPLSGRGAFSFTRTFLGTKIDKIRGQLVSDTRIEGFVVYHFEGQSDLCGAGSAKVRFGANRKKK